MSLLLNIIIILLSLVNILTCQEEIPVAPAGAAIAAGTITARFILVDITLNRTPYKTGEG